MNEKTGLVGSSQVWRNDGKLSVTKIRVHCQKIADMDARKFVKS